MSELSEITLIDVSVVDEELHYYTIYFIEPYHRIDNVGVVFDDEYRLVDKFRRVGIGDVGPIECPQLDFIHLDIKKKQGKLRQTLRQEVADANPARRIYHDP